MLVPLAYVPGDDTIAGGAIVQVSPLTGLIGANDVGKTRLLRGLQMALLVNQHDDHTGGAVGQLILKADQTDLRRLLDVPDDQDIEETLVERLEAHRLRPITADERRVIQHALQDVHLATAGARETDLALAFPLASAPEGIRDSLTALGFQRPVNWPTDVPIGVIGLPHGVERLSSGLAPSAVALPAGPSQVIEAVQRAMTVLLSAFSVVEDAKVSGALEPLGIRSETDPTVCAMWEARLLKTQQEPWLHPSLSPPDGSERVNPWLTTAADLLSAVADHLLPMFIASTYELGVHPTPLSAWIGGDVRAWPGLRRRGTKERPFDSDDVAEGFRIWVQVTLLDAARICEQIGTWLSEAFARSEREQGLLGADPWLEDVAPVVELLMPFRERTGSLALEHVEQLVEQIHPYAGDAPAIEQINADRHTVYLFDEPERHLHPALQHQAAAWLANRATAGNTTVIFATHAVAFMALSDHARYHYTFRDQAGRSHLAPIEPRALRAADLVAEELGLDRGELLAFVRQVVFVEGETDRLFMEELYGPELDRAGIVLIPLGGATRSQTVMPMATLLLRYTTAAVAVVLDDVARESFDRLVTDPEYRAESARSSKQVELRELARLMVLAVEQERTIVPLGIPVKDIFDLIDEDVVRDTLNDPSCGRFPGHEAARALVGDGKWKEVYRKRYGIDVLNVATFAHAGREMRARGARSEVLDDLLSLTQR